MEDNKRRELAFKLSKVTQFNEAECACLLDAYGKLVAAGGPLNFKHFRKVAGLVFAQVLSDVHLLFRTFDQSDRGVIGAVDWVHGFSKTIRGNTDELANTFYQLTKNDPKLFFEPKKTARNLSAIYRQRPASAPKIGTKSAVDFKEEKKCLKSFKKKSNVVKCAASPPAPRPPRVPFGYRKAGKETCKHFDIGCGVIRKAAWFGISLPKTKSSPDLNSKSIAVIRVPGGELEQNACRNNSSHKKFMKLQKAYGIYWNGRIGNSRKLSVII